jgi:hypothetical protein
MVILDIDLDFFVTPIRHEVETDERLPEGEYSVESCTAALGFLRDACGLPLDRSVRGVQFEHHDEVFDFVVENLPDALEWIHVDAHADIGGGWRVRCWPYIFCEFTHLDQAARRKPLRGPNGLNCGNFLLFLAGCNKLKDVTFVTPPTWKNDYQAIYMKEFSETSGAIQLKRYSKSATSCMTPLHLVKHDVEPPIPYKSVPRADFKASAKPDLVLLTRSPGFTTASSDVLYNAIANCLLL